MTRSLVLAPATRENLHTLVPGATPEQILEHLSPREGRALMEALGHPALVHCWAMTKGSRGVFKKLEAGDLVLFTTRASGRFELAGSVAYRLEHPALGSVLWKRGSGWTLIYFVGWVKRVSIPKRELLRALGYDEKYRLPGVNRLPPEKVGLALDRFPDLESLWNGPGMGTTPDAPRPEVQPQPARRTKPPRRPAPPPASGPDSAPTPPPLLAPLQPPPPRPRGVLERMRDGIARLILRTPRSPAPDGEQDGPGRPLPAPGPLDDIALTRQARLALARRGIGEQEIRAALRAPARRAELRPGRVLVAGPGRGDALHVVVDTTGASPLVVTVYRASSEHPPEDRS